MAWFSFGLIDRCRHVWGLKSATSPTVDRETGRKAPVAQASVAAIFGGQAICAPRIGGATIRQSMRLALALPQPFAEYTPFELGYEVLNGNF
jgi:hypothetical protein